MKIAASKLLIFLYLSHIYITSASNLASATFTHYAPLTLSTLQPNYSYAELHKLCLHYLGFCYSTLPRKTRFKAAVLYW